MKCRIRTWLTRETEIDGIASLQTGKVFHGSADHGMAAEGHNGDVFAGPIAAGVDHRDSLLEEFLYSGVTRVQPCQGTVEVLFGFPGERRSVATGVG